MTFSEIIERININPYYKDEWCAIYHADCRDILPLIPEKSIDLVLTDPPYGVDKTEWDLKDNWTNLLAYLGKFVRTQRLAIVFSSTRYIGETIKVMGLPYRWQFIAYSPNNMIPADIGFAKYTSALIFSNLNSIFCNAQDLREFMTGTRELKNSEHPTPKPIPIISYLIEHFTQPDFLILDPFLGSGTTCYCAKKLNRYSIGIEIEEKYCDIAAKRCSQTVMRLEI